MVLYCVTTVEKQCNSRYFSECIVKTGPVGELQKLFKRGSSHDAKAFWIAILILIVHAQKDRHAARVRNDEHTAGLQIQ